MAQIVKGKKKGSEVEEEWVGEGEWVSDGCFCSNYKLGGAFSNNVYIMYIC